MPYRGRRELAAETRTCARAFVATPSIDPLTAAFLDENLEFVRYLVDPRNAEGKRLAFTMAAEGDPRIRRVECATACS